MSPRIPNGAKLMMMRMMRGDYGGHVIHDLEGGLGCYGPHDESGNDSPEEDAEVVSFCDRGDGVGHHSGEQFRHEFLQTAGCSHIRDISRECHCDGEREAQDR
ncbi:MAG: hypothetical protein IJV90_01065, partial [Candidatus Methanomethylophilaceae archaeon]|nr:hypothetical protein [Candidatus Methanomethylophilaceae archaeon]